jgi:hypothetical protein
MHRLHDAEIVGLDHKDDRLVVTLRSAVGLRCVMAFTQVLDWSFSPFEPQNVILDFYAYDQATLSEHILSFFGVDESSGERVYSGEVRLYCYAASVGMEGFVLAKELTIDGEPYPPTGTLGLRNSPLRFCCSITNPLGRFTKLAAKINVPQTCVARDVLCEPSYPKKARFLEGFATRSNGPEN